MRSGPVYFLRGDRKKSEVGAFINQPTREAQDLQTYDMGFGESYDVSDAAIDSGRPRIDITEEKYRRGANRLTTEITLQIKEKSLTNVDFSITQGSIYTS